MKIPASCAKPEAHLALGPVLPLDVADQCIVLGTRHVTWACARAHELVKNGTTIKDARSGHLLERRRRLRSLELGLPREGHERRVCCHGRRWAYWVCVGGGSH